MPLIESGTANLVPCVTNISPAIPLYAPAGSGGGGGGGPTLQVSTIQFGPGQFGLGVLDVTNPATLAINNNTTAAINDIEFTTNNTTTYDTPANFIEINSPDAGNSLSFIAQNNGDNLIISPQGNLGIGVLNSIEVSASSISLLAPTSISSLTVSSINGAVPGSGSAGPDLTVSTITFPQGNQTTNGVINMISSLAFNDSNTPVTQDILFYTNFATATEPIIIPYLSTANAIQVNGPGGNAATGELILAGSADGRTLIASSTGNGTLSTLNIVADNVNMPTNLNVSTINSGSLGTLAIGGNLTVFNQLACSGLSTNQISPVSGTTVTISSIQVSSINNAAYPPASSAYPKISSINVGGGGSQTSYPSISTNSLAQFTTPFDIEQNHCYEVSWNYQLKPSSAAQFTDYATFTTVGVNSGTQSVTVPLAVSTLTQSRLFFIGQNTGSTYLACSTETSYPVELDLTYNTENVNLVDLGVLGTSF